MPRTVTTYVARAGERGYPRSLDGGTLMEDVMRSRAVDSIPDDRESARPTWINADVAEFQELLGIDVKPEDIRYEDVPKKDGEPSGIVVGLVASNDGVGLVAWGPDLGRWFVRLDGRGGNAIPSNIVQSDVSGLGARDAVERRYLTSSEAARFLGRSNSAIYHLVGRERIPHRRVGGRLQFDREELARWYTKGPGVSVRTASDADRA